MAADAALLVRQAELAQEAERYDDMVDFVKKLAALRELTAPERNLFAFAFSKRAAQTRAAWRACAGIEAKAKGSGNADHGRLAQAYREQLERELLNLCRDAITTVEDGVLPLASTPEARSMYLKMCGDFFRYVSEFASEAARGGAVDNAVSKYVAAGREADALPPMHPVRLSLALNHAILLQEIVRDTVGACEVAKAAFDAAITELDHADAAHYSDATLLLQLLRDNIATWAAAADPGH